MWDGRATKLCGPTFPEGQRAAHSRILAPKSHSMPQIAGMAFEARVLNMEYMDLLCHVDCGCCVKALSFNVSNPKAGSEFSVFGVAPVRFQP